jgi:hypothetical protein
MGRSSAYHTQPPVDLKKRALSTTDWHRFCTKKRPTESDIRAWPAGSLPVAQWDKQVRRQYKNVKTAFEKLDAEAKGTLATHRAKIKVHNEKRRKEHTDPEKWKEVVAKKTAENKAVMKTQRGRLGRLVTTLKTKCHPECTTQLKPVVENGLKYVRHHCDKDGCRAQADCCETDLFVGSGECSACGESCETIYSALVEPTSGYVTGNFVGLCFFCKMFKKGGTVADFCAHAARITEHQQSDRSSVRTALDDDILEKKWSGYRRSHYHENKDGRRTIALGEDDDDPEMITKQEFFEIFCTSCNWCGKQSTAEEPSCADRSTTCSHTYAGTLSHRASAATSSRPSGACTKNHLAKILSPTWRRFTVTSNASKKMFDYVPCHRNTDASRTNPCSASWR